MKARIAPRVSISQKELEAVIDAEVQKRYRDIVSTACVNTMSLVLFTLDKQYGFRKRRLWRFLGEMTASDKLLTDGIFGKKANNEELLGYLKDRYYIDLEKELTREV